jgi:hypothetical protein
MMYSCKIEFGENIRIVCSYHGNPARMVAHTGYDSLDQWGGVSGKVATLRKKYCEYITTES